MQQIRNRVFETNSSSTHSICITKDRRNLKLPDKLLVRPKYFGWEHKTLCTPQEKAEYLYASILCTFSRREAEAIKNELYQMLIEEGVDCEFVQAAYYDFNEDFCEDAGVDHAGCDDHLNFVNRVITNKNRLLRYLFSEDSFVITGNDNGYDPVDIKADYPHEEYYKGN